MYKEPLYVTVLRTEAERGRPIRPTACCTFRGSVAALDMADGRSAVEELHGAWRSPGHTVKVIPAFSIRSRGRADIWLRHRLIDTMRGLLYVATGKSYTATDLEPALTDSPWRPSTSPTASCVGSNN